MAEPDGGEDWCARAEIEPKLRRIRPSFTACGGDIVEPGADLGLRDALTTWFGAAPTL